MGSRSDLEVMGHATATLERLEIPYEVRVVSAHRTPERLRHFAEQAEMRGIEAIIAGAGAAAALAGVTAAHTLLPVLGVPLDATPLRGVDALYATVQMPRGIPVATFAIGKSGAVNAALFAAAMFACREPELRERIAAYRKAEAEALPERPL
jgi:5-(carboxyamino)imidazole ribonucleotide mutase